MKPNANPFAMLDVSGIMMIVRNAGSAFVKSEKSILPTSDMSSAPTRISAGAVAKAGTRPMSGAKRSAARKSTPAATAVRPVRPPAAMPAALST